MLEECSTVPAIVRVLEEDMNMKRKPSLLNIGILVLAQISILSGACLWWGCNAATPTQGTDPFTTSILAPQASQGEVVENPIPPVENAPPRQATGELVIRGNYGQCVQSTSYDRDYMSVFVIGEGGSQSRGAFYKGAEGTLTQFCGKYIQIDCTVRDSDPQAGNISAYDLYDFFIGVLECPESVHIPRTPEPPEDDPSEDPEPDPCQDSFLTVERVEGGYEVCSSAPYEYEFGHELNFYSAGCTTFPVPDLECGSETHWHLKNECGDLKKGTLYGPECPPEDDGVCIYEISGPKADKQSKCEAVSGGFWSDGSQHCVLDLPGISNSSFNLTPGQSHPDCLRKQD